MPPRLPRDISGDDLIARLGTLGFVTVRQSGSHVRLTASRGDREAHITVPRHHALRVGTLSGILSDVAAFLEVERDEVVSRLFG